MIFLSLNKNSIHYARIDDDRNWKSLKFIKKAPLPLNIKNDSFTTIKDFGVLRKSIVNLLDTIRDEKDNQLIVSLPEWVATYKIVRLDKFIRDDYEEEVLYELEKLRLGEQFGNYKIQFYRIYKYYFDDYKYYLELIIHKNIIKKTEQIFNEIGCDLKAISIGFYDALYGMSKILPKARMFEDWALCKINEDSNIVGYVRNGEIYSIAGFTFGQESGYKVHFSSDSNDSMAILIDELNKMRFSPTEKLVTIDRIYIYSDDIYSDNFNTFLTYRIENMEVINPFVEYPIGDIYRGDGDGAGAMSQFLAMFGIIQRYIDGSI